MSFEELQLPAEETIHPAHFGKWFVTIKIITHYNKGMLLSDGNGIEQAVIGTDHTQFYFDSEIQAHSVASLYYFVHGMSYPYMLEYHAAMEAAINNTVPVGAGTYVQSQEMIFI